MRVLFYVTNRGRSPVRDFLEELPVALRAAVFRTLELIEEEGLRAPGVSFRQIDGKLWEIRVMTGGSARVFYVCRTADEIVLLHGYKKQSQKAPAREIEVAQRRMREVLEG